jgi:hypothetical protein
MLEGMIIRNDQKGKTQYAEKFNLGRKQNGRKITERTKQQHPIYGILHLRGKWRREEKS